jgi:hypothetical protein
MCFILLSQFRVKRFSLRWLGGFARIHANTRLVVCATFPIKLPDISENQDSSIIFREVLHYYMKIYISVLDLLFTYRQTAGWGNDLADGAPGFKRPVGIID